MLKKSFMALTAALILSIVAAGCAGLPPAEVLGKGEDTATVYFTWADRG